MNKLKALVRRRELIVVLLIVIIMITLQIATNGKFLTSANLRVIANRKSPRRWPRL